MIQLNRFLKDLGMKFIIWAYQDYGKLPKIYHVTFVQPLFDDIYLTIEYPYPNEHNKRNQVLMLFGITTEERL